MKDSTFEILDCTLRDGGLACKACFSIETARKIFQASCLAGINYVELGYRNSSAINSPDKSGPLQFCDEETLEQIVRGVNRDKIQIAIMQDAHKAKPEDLSERRDSVVDMIRIASYIPDLDKAISLADKAGCKGYECSINFMAVSTVSQADLTTALQRVSKETDVKTVYMVDSYGALLPDDLVNLFQIFNQFKNRFKIGVHFHNSLQLAFANTLKSISMGADIIDTTLFGIGRGAGNCPTELILDHFSETRFKLRPLIKIIQDQILPLRSRAKWGYHLPYMLGGNRNQHPGRAADWLRRKNDLDLLDFFDQITVT